jgi:DNA repair protein SbcC/Rad50
MIKQVIVKNFESHEHSVVDFDDGFNLIVGPSNSGKSSLIRAVRLAAYGEWNPESLRKGTKICEVTVITDKGMVKVQRGSSINEWDVTPDGQPTQHFSKPGKGVVKEASDVIGLRIVKLGTQEIKPNVMDQLEGHFMMSEIEGEKTSGSTRAQVIDEISGLAGMEELIRQVNLDNVRGSREIKQIEQDIKDIESGMHDQKVLDAERLLLEQAEADLSKVAESILVINEAKQMAHDVCEAKNALAESQKNLNGIPQLKPLENSLKNAQESLIKARGVLSLANEAGVANQTLTDSVEALNGIPDVSTATCSLDKAKDKLETASSAVTMAQEAKDALNVLATTTDAINRIPDVSTAFGSLDKAKDKLQTASLVTATAQEAKAASDVLTTTTDAINRIPDTFAADKIIGKISTNLDSAESTSAMLSRVVSEGLAIVAMNDELKVTDEELLKANESLATTMSEIEICPICLGPRHEGCGHKPQKKAKL